MVYLDNAATTFVDKEAINIINKSLLEDYINPSSIYNAGRQKYAGLYNCKERISNNLGLINGAKNIYFTSGGCEGNNWVIKGMVMEYYKSASSWKIPHIITTMFEHHSILNACEQMADLGLIKLTLLQPNTITGTIDPDDIIKNIAGPQDSYKTILVSVMWVNNILGTIQPIQEISEICNQHSIAFHTDAVQASGNVHIDLSKYHIDLLTISGHKFHAPKGIGIVYIDESIKIQPLISGGGQEFGLRAGTENLPYIKAITYCLEKYNNQAYIESKHPYIENIKNIFDNKLKVLKDVKLFKAPIGIGTINVAFKDVIADVLVYNLGMDGYMISVGSACDNGNFEDNHVLVAMDYNKDYIKGNVRITFNEFNTVDDVNKFIDALTKHVKDLRGYLL